MKNINVFLFCVFGLLVTTNTLPRMFPFDNFLSFPIKGVRYGLNSNIASYDCLECLERIPLSSTLRIILSGICYGLLLAIPASIPLCLAKRFKSHSFYQAYKTFWLWGAFIFLLLTAVLTGEMYVGTSIEGIISLVTWYITIACLAILPAYLQHKYYNKP
ncbi:hypothetical protein [Methyloglobulus sp.]|uniref:hypothetical protein n=1 Tax=Methyloglobulus sp. TaxID=2518622 RepID=UPI0032B7E7B1